MALTWSDLRVVKLIGRLSESDETRRRARDRDALRVEAAAVGLDLEDADLDTVASAVESIPPGQIVARSSEVH